MNDLLYASLFLCIFALALMAYGAILAKTGNKELLPMRAIHSVRGPEDVKRVGRIVVVVGLVVGIVFGILAIASLYTS